MSVSRRKRLFTVVMDFEGTTSVSQFRARSVEDAVRLWRKDLDQWGIYGLNEPQRKRLAAGYGDVELGIAPVLLDGLQNVWCSSVSARRKGSALLNIVETVQLSKP